MNIAKMLVIAAIIAPICQAADTPAPAASNSQIMAEKLLDLAGTKGLMQQGFEIGLKPALDGMKAQGMPDELIDAIRAESQRFFEENFKWEEIEPQIVKLYVQTFTESELRDIVAFYETPTGRKAVSKVPTLTQQGVAMAMGRVRAKMPEFQQRVGTLIENYKKKTAEAAQAAKAAQLPAGTLPAAPQDAHPQ